MFDEIKLIFIFNYVTYIEEFLWIYMIISFFKPRLLNIIWFPILSLIFKLESVSIKEKYWDFMGQYELTLLFNYRSACITTFNIIMIFNFIFVFIEFLCA